MLWTRSGRRRCPAPEAPLPPPRCRFCRHLHPAGGDPEPSLCLRGFAWVGLVVALASPGPAGSVGRVASLAPVSVGETEGGASTISQSRSRGQEGGLDEPLEHPGPWAELLRGPGRASLPFAILGGPATPLGQGLGTWRWGGYQVPREGTLVPGWGKLFTEAYSRGARRGVGAGEEATFFVFKLLIWK